MKIKHLAPGTYFQWKLGGCASIFEAVDPAAETYRIVAEFVGMVPMVLAHPGAETRLQKSRDVKPLRPWAVALLLAAIPKDWPERQPLAATPGVTAWGQDVKPAPSNCDGCARGLPVRGGLHVTGDGHPVQGCVQAAP